MSGGVGRTEESKALYRRITDEIWSTGRLDLVDELVDRHLVDHVDLPGLTGAGRDRYRASVQMVREAFPDYHEEILWLVADGDLAAAYVRSTGTHRGPLYGIPPTGRRATFHSMGALRFAGGRAVERWGMGDSAELLLQLGISP
ncbi:MAG TPA: ester cyclase [Acidimicrobiales bacterium]|nr:ester cyclase [Acidimicrobiales bacterium]